jgi:hypothetical protein
LRNRIKDLETILVREFRPNFLSISYEENEKDPFIHVVISAGVFSDIPIQTRVALVYDKLFSESSNLVPVLPIIVETFNSKEMVEIFEHFKI